MPRKQQKMKDNDLHFFKILNQGKNVGTTR